MPDHGWTILLEAMGTKAGEMSEEGGTITASVPVSFFPWMVAVPSPTSGLDNEELAREK